MNVIEYVMKGAIEKQKIYTGINEVSGGWIATTCGDPVCTENLISDAPDEHDRILALIDGKTTSCNYYACRKANSEDYEYVSEVLGAWGIMTADKVLENLRALVGKEFDPDDVVCAFEDFEEYGETEVIVSDSYDSSYNYSAYIDAEDSTQFLISTETETGEDGEPAEIITDVWM